MKVLNALSRKNSDDLFNVTGYLLKTLNVNFTRGKLYETVRKHADYPSLLTLKDTFSSFGIQSEAISKAQYSYEDFETPYVASIQKEDWPKAHFTTVINAENGYIEFLDPISHKIQLMTIGQFEMIDKNVILLLDPSAPKDEENYLENKKRERNKILLQQTPLFLMCIAFFMAISPVLLQPLNADSWYNLGFVITSLAGLGITSLLIWREIDAHNPFLKEVCGGGSRKLNCEAVLSSSSSAFLGINWSVWGFAFFSTFFAEQVLFPSAPSVILMWCALSIAVAPYIAFSIYHQWFVIKQWCPLCLGVQGILAINLFISAMYFFDNGVSLENISYYGIIVTLLLGLIFLFFAYIIIPVIQSANDSKDYEQKWKSLKFNPEIFQALLERSEKIFVPTENLGIVLGNPDARHEIVKVCNPYCGPCSKAHPELETILHKNPDVKIRIIFTANGDENDNKTPPVKHLLAIEEVYGSDTVRKALDDWYLAPEKDYDIFALKYPMNDELENQTEKIQKMHSWCDNMKIRATPTIYVNGRELPDSYKVSELKNFF